MRSSRARQLLAVVCWLALAGWLRAQEVAAPAPAEPTAPSASEPAGVFPLARPGDREFIVDKANLIAEVDKEHIRQLADKLLTEKKAPIIVVTLPSLAEYNGAGMRVETFARLLFDQWEIGFHGKGQNWNYGMLLLVVVEERKARIELGHQWGRQQDVACEQIMQSLIIPPFKAGDYSGGITAGVEGLDKIARGLRPPSPPWPAWAGPAFIGAGVLMLLSGISFYRSGSRGWAWFGWGVFFTVLFVILKVLASSRSGRGSYRGGSFGGGFSGGGGATGSW